MPCLLYAGCMTSMGQPRTPLTRLLHSEKRESPRPSDGHLQMSKVYILDKHLQPTPIGVPGELHIGGAGLARGYLNHPELTREKFIPSPFAGDNGARLYKTGDLARFRPDGNIECLGRLDHQVKIRGFRIELGEIEAVLRQHPNIKDVVVVAQAQNGDQWLLAYFAPKNNPPRPRMIYGSSLGRCCPTTWSLRPL